MASSQVSSYWSKNGLIVKDEPGDRVGLWRKAESTSRDLFLRVPLRLLDLISLPLAAIWVHGTLRGMIGAATATAASIGGRRRRRVRTRLLAKELGMESIEDTE